MTRQIAFVVAAVSLATGAVGYAGAVWFTNDLGAFELGVVPAVLAAALVWYFEWRTGLRRRILSDSRGHRQASEIGADQGRMRAITSADPSQSRGGHRLPMMPVEHAVVPGLDPAARRRG
jgi:hypothetical protein